MYYLKGLENNINNIIAIAKRQNHDIQTLTDLKRGYLNAVSELQQDVSYNKDCALAHFLAQTPYYSEDLDEILSLTRKYKDFSLLTDIQDVSDSMEAPKLTSIEKAKPAFVRAITQLKEFDEDLYGLMLLAVNTFFYCPATNNLGGGSTSSAVGVIWCSYKQEWTTDDIIEFLVHELTHQLVFIDEIAIGHYYDMDALAEPRNFAISSILRKPRPLDKVIHALIVANEIQKLRGILKLKGTERAHPSSEILRTSIPTSIDSILSMNNIDQLIKPRVFELIESIQVSNLEAA
ncbi:hypothetical protein FT643_15775 [Ketobacter sp. MCCC 1A13808]|uniref:aKG-HExxH-type peptide beta-hydroxylase n=1 Tax=Ketobacter sp. MCCC 1A13808 TaxID=2602738 RepID=UPI0012EBEE8F|nr:HEXXH motif-containing putative peptide modification protein [Ketobacter sp. MCCC 1A13808]MVF13601.1 hypothetical protein [Ketobacter sp. MCCC 1A13808]